MFQSLSEGSGSNTVEDPMGGIRVVESLVPLPEPVPSH